jgi:cathepsin D
MGSDSTVLDVNCAGCPSFATGYDASRSNTAVVSSTRTNSNYYDGIHLAAFDEGVVTTDVFSLGDFNVSPISFCEIITPYLYRANDNSSFPVNIDKKLQNIEVDPVTAILGLGPGATFFGGVSFWSALVATGALPRNEFAFYLERNVYAGPESTNSQPGGQFTIGGTNPSYYTGAIEYLDVPFKANATYRAWALPFPSYTIQNQTVVLDTVTTAYFFNDYRGITGPVSDVAAFYRRIPGSYALGGDLAGQYAYRE